MATSLASVQISTTAVVPKAETPNNNLPPKAPPLVSFPWRNKTSFRLAAGGPTTPPDLSEKVEESIKDAEKTCAEDPQSGECAAAWDEVEELSATASHARDRLKTSSSSDPLETYCKDNPETDECRTYED